MGSRRRIHRCVIRNSSEYNKSFNMINDNQLVLLELLKASLFGLVPVIPDSTDWDKVLEEANAQTVTAIAAKVVPEAHSGPWKMEVMQNQARFIRMFHGQTQLVNLFCKSDIPLVVLKGVAAAKYYPVPCLRSMGDVDILVFQEQFDAAADLLRTNGYNCIQEMGVNPRHMEFTKNGILFELHHHFSSEGFACDEILKSAMPRRTECVLDQHRFPILPEMENGLVLLGHIQQHLRDNRLGMRQIIDWMMFVHTCLTDDAWETSFRRLAQDVGLELLAINITKLCKNWLGLSDPIFWCDSGDNQLAEELLSVVFECGNMGRKGVASRSPVEGVSLQIKKYGLFRWLYDYGCKWWPVAKKHKMLKPLVIMYGIGRLTVKGIKAKQNGTSITEQMSKGIDRYELYKKLGLHFSSFTYKDSK